MGLVLVPSEVAQMISELRKTLADVMEGYKSALRAIIIFSKEERLKTDTWDTFKEKVADYHDAIVRGMILAEESLLTDAAMEHSFGSEELDEDKLDEDIKKLETEKQGYVSELEALKQISNSPIGALVGKAFAKTAIGILKDNISAIEAEIRILDAKKGRLYSIENNTRNLFKSAGRLLLAVKYAINDAGVEITGEGEMSKVDWRTTISDAYENVNSFRTDLRLQGFPEEYVECLMELHKKYPEWKFEAVVTGIDYQEFVDYQMNNKTKCVDIKDKDIVGYSTGIHYEAEKASKYKEVKREGIIQFSNPCNIIRQAKDDYTCMIQFLKFEQEFPQEYVDTVVPQMLPHKKDEIVVELIKKSNSCINPLLLACMYKAENGPNGAEYNGKKVYNFFNIGAGGGGEYAKKKAFRYGWFSEKDCMEGSETTFQNYIENGQDTLYALDWDYQSYANKGVVERQYATLVNDAQNKAEHFTYGKKEDDDLNQSYVFKIPVYENIPPLDEEEFKIFQVPAVE